MHKFEEGCFPISQIKTLPDKLKFDKGYADKLDMDSFDIPNFSRHNN
jgi:hypothetical protein